MKKLKLFFLAVICACCLCFVFTGCSDPYTYVAGSFNYTVSTDNTGYFSQYKINYSFQVYILADGDYNVDCIYSYKTKDGLTADKQVTEKLYGCKKGETKTVSGSFNLTKSEKDYGFDKNSGIKFTIGKPQSSSNNDKSIGYAIGFGVAGGVILESLIILFIVLKVKKKI